MRTLREAVIEKALIDELKGLGLEAYHLDTGVVGFPDMIVLGRRAILVEMKAHKPDELLSSVMEPGQPVRIREIQRAGFDCVYVCNAYNGTYYLYDPIHILEKSMNGERLNSLSLLMAAPVHSVAEKLAEVCNAR